MVSAEAPSELSSTLRARTAALHRRAEQSGVIADMLGGRVGRRAYALFLRNLLPAYQAMEVGLEQHRLSAAVGPMARPEVYRADALEADLVALEGLDWPGVLPLLPAGAHYGACLVGAAKGDGVPLIGHAYVRYLGDLSGGQILKRLLAKSLRLEPGALSFYEFPEIRDVGAYKRSFRDTLDRSTPPGDRERVVEAAVLAFALNMSISDSVSCAAARMNDR
jgi:heme oxygenase